jgi:hypothetical protein
MKITRKQTRWFLGGHIPLDNPTAWGGTVNWFVVNKQFDTKREAMLEAKSWRKRFATHNKMPTFTLRREQVQTYREFF